MGKGERVEEVMQNVSEIASALARGISSTVQIYGSIRRSTQSEKISAFERTVSVGETINGVITLWDSVRRIKKTVMILQKKY